MMAQNKKCVWMSAGIVNYKLCDRNFRCEECPFNRLMQGMLPAVETGEAKSPAVGMAFPKNKEAGAAPEEEFLSTYLFSFLSDCTLYLDRCYYPGHFWCKPQSEHEVCLGLDPFSMKILHPIDQLILPEKGGAYSKDQLVGWIRRRDKMIPLHSPFSATVVEVDRNLGKKNLALLNWNQTCLFKMRGKDLKKEVQAMCGEVSGLHWYQKKVSILRKHLARAIASQRVPAMGITLADGGELSPCLEDVLGKEEFDQLIRELFISGSP